MEKVNKSIKVINGSIRLIKGYAKYLKFDGLNISSNERQSLFLMDMTKNATKGVEIKNNEHLLQMNIEMKKIDKNWGDASLENFRKVF